MMSTSNLFGSLIYVFVNKLANLIAFLVSLPLFAMAPQARHDKCNQESDANLLETTTQV